MFKQNQLFFFILFLFLSIVKITNALGKEEKNDENLAMPGIYSSIKLLLNNSNIQMNEIKKIVKSEVSSFSEIKDAKEIFLNPHFISQILLKSDDKYIYQTSKNLCNFLHLIENNTFQNIIKSDNLVADIIYSNGEKKTKLIKKDIYIKYQYQKTCVQNADTSKLFLSKNLSKTLNNFEITIPHNLDECKKIYQDFLSRNDITYLCEISELSGKINKRNALSSHNTKKSYQNIKENIISEMLTPIKSSYLENICQDLQNHHFFCHNYLKNNYWDKVLTKEKEDTPLIFQCQGILKKFNITSKDFSYCIREIKNNPGLCHYNNSNIYPSLTPKPDCQKISKGLLSSRIYLNYNDCPGKVQNQGIINTTRILEYFSKDKNKEAILEKKCFKTPILKFINYVTKNSYAPIWDYQICYNDPILNGESCSLFFHGNDKNSPYSETKVMSQALIRTRGAPSSLTCKIKNEKKFNPHFLDSKRGCILLYQERNCSPLHCPKKIIYNGEVIENIEYKGRSFFYYFEKDRFTIHNSMNEILKDKTRLKQKKIENITQLRISLTKKTNIIHGVGCAEDIFPSFFHQNSINNCRPITFIIEGINKINEIDFVTVKTSLDDPFSPRIIPWHQIYTAVKNYSFIHLHNIWPMYEITQ